jgi:hypothetical protein
MTALVSRDEDFVSVNIIGNCAFRDPGLFKR